jgi:hypothetical protein
MHSANRIYFKVKFEIGILIVIFRAHNGLLNKPLVN